MRKAGFAALLLVICFLAAVPAKADHIISFLTDYFGYYGEPLDSGFCGDGICGNFALDPANSTYTQYTQCDQFGACRTSYWGQFSGGTGTVSVALQNNSVITLNPIGIRGSYYGYIYFDQYGDYDQNEWGTFVFRGDWSNGWYSTFNGDYFWDYFFGTDGNLGIRTQSTPEPTSLALLGSGVLGLIGYRRKRR